MVGQDGEAVYIVGLKVVGAIVPKHDPLSVQACSQAVPVPGLYASRVHQPGTLH